MNRAQLIQRFGNYKRLDFHDKPNKFSDIQEFFETDFADSEIKEAGFNVKKFRKVQLYAGDYLDRVLSDNFY